MNGDIRAARQCKQELAMARGLEDLKNLLPVQILVTCSLGLHVILFLCAGVRRRETSSTVSVVRLRLLWLAYNFGDTFAKFTIGRLTLSTVTSNNPLFALWAPFLLLHLAGPDNIAAYALQDSELSLRSLQTFFALVSAGGYFLYKYGNSSGHFLPLASRLMFIVAVVKYWERWLALQRGNLGSIRDSLKNQPPAMYNHVHREDVKLIKIAGFETLDEESSVRRAHSLFHICMCAMVDSSEEEPGRQDFERKMEYVEFRPIVEIQLSLMYDILYTKAAVIHTWHGYAIRVISPLAILASLLLFHLSEEDGHREVDTAMTYVLFVSALSMELISLLNTLGSSWMFAYLCTTRSTWLRYTFLCSGRWNRLRRLVASLSYLVTCGRSSRSGARRWSGHMGQYNMLHFCTRPKAAGPLFGRLAKLLGYEEWWNRKHFSGAINISDHDIIMEYINYLTHQLYTGRQLDPLGMITLKWGMITLKDHQVVDKFERTLGSEFQEGIVVWHIGTDIFISMCNCAYVDGRLVKAIKALSNYMMFLLVERPYMLPGIAQNKLYERTCKDLEVVVTSYNPPSMCAVLKSLFGWRDDPAGYTSMATHSRVHAEKLYGKHVALTKFSYHTVAEQLLLYEKEYNTTKSLKLLLEFWTEMLVYASNKCSRESHAKKLSSGGELTTIVWLIVELFNQAGSKHDEEQASAKEASRKDDNYSSV